MKLTRLKFLFFILWAYAFCPVLSQNIAVKGRALSLKNNTPLENVTVKLGKHGKITNAKGDFAFLIDKKEWQKDTLTLSAIGFVTKKIFFSELILNEINIIKLKDTATTLTDVSVTTGSRILVEKAIKKIPLNYQTVPVTVAGIMRIYNLINDSDYFFKSDALVNAYIYPTSLNKNPDIKIVQNENVLFENKKSSYYTNAPENRWVGGYYSIYDLVHESPRYLNLNHIDDYKFFSEQNERINNRTTFVVNFVSKNRLKEEGTLYIDSLTLAFVKIEILKYDIKELMFVPIKSSKLTVNYELINGEWYIKNSRYESIHDMKYPDKYIVNFVRTSIDSSDVKKFTYREITQRRDENKKVNIQSPVTAHAAELKKNMDSLQTDGSITFFAYPKYDTVTPPVNLSFQKKLSNALIKYIQNGGLRIGIALSKLPVSISSNTFNVTNLVPYSVCFTAQYKLYKSLFFQADNAYNFGLGGSSIKEEGYYLTNIFEINKKHRKISISPYIGYSKINFKTVKTKLRSAVENWVAGTGCTLEITHKLSYWASFSYNDILKNNLSSNNFINPVSFSYNAGIIYKL